MFDTSVEPLPRGRHQLTREQVEETQRIRIFLAMADAMAEHGYVGTSVAKVLAGAGVSRETFYQLFDGKLECFLAACDFVGDALVGHLAATVSGGAAQQTAIERFDRTLTAYLDALASAPALARLFLVEVHAAGPEAMARRAALQRRLADAMAALLGARTDGDRFACQVVVAATSAMVAGPLVAGDTDALRALGPPILDHVRRLFDRRAPHANSA
jgi:AcrR family transcriptional regulator